MKNSELIATIEERFPAAVLATHDWRGDATVTIKAPALLEIAQYLRDDPSYTMNLLVDVSAVDYSTFGKGAAPAFFDSSGVKVQADPLIQDEEPWPGRPTEDRYTVVYHFYSTALKHRLRLLVPLDEDAPSIASLSELWAGANWLEREVWDMFGIDFSGHPDQRRILMYAEFEGHPLRKDYRINKRQPLIGPVN